MDDVPIYFSLADSTHWEGIPLPRALEWTRVLLRWHPSVPGTIIRLVRPNLERGVPAGFTDWAARARLAESLGFTPAGYAALQESLDAIDPAEHPAHPDNHLVKAGITAVRPFEVDRWASWPRFVAEGLDPAAATSLLLLEETGDGSRSGR